MALFCPHLTCANLQDKLNHLMKGGNLACAAMTFEEKKRGLIISQFYMKGEEHHKSDRIKNSHHMWLGRKKAVFSSDTFF